MIRLSTDRKGPPLDFKELRTVTLCGSTRFSKEFEQAATIETFAGKVVLTIGCNMKSDAELFASLSDDHRMALKKGLDLLHIQKIEASDEILVLNVDGYIGESTGREISYAVEAKKGVRFLIPPSADVLRKYPGIILAGFGFSELDPIIECWCLVNLDMPEAYYNRSEEAKYG